MEFWPENQGQSPLYAKFGTIPGRNCSHNYHDRHQAAHYPLYFSEQQDQGRESSYWTVPGSRTEGSLQEFTTWMDPELPAPASSHFPFILDRHTQQRQDLSEYHSREARERQWTAAQRPSTEHERGFLRDGWQRRWEPCSPARYNREVSSKRSDSSYRELEAWAARYCHSLPRRRRLEAELRGASQGLIESSRAPERDGRIGTDPQVAALQQLRQSANSRESGVRDTGVRLPTPNYYQSQALAPDTSHMLDGKEKTGYQMRMFSQPPGYTAPPPYNSPHKSTPVMHHCDASWEQESKRHTYWSQPTLRKDAPVEPQCKTKGEKKDCTKPDESKSRAELDGVKHRRQETDALQAVAPVSVQTTTMQHESLLCPQQTETIPTVHNTNKQTSSKIIEGRKFKLNKKTGGMTIFCLVSRIAGITETPSLPLCISQTNVQNIALVDVSKGPQDSNDDQTNPADEVDFRAPDVTEQSNTSDVSNVKQKGMQTYTESEMHGEQLSNNEVMGNVSPGNKKFTDVNSTSGRESKLPVSVKYPLWREPSFTSRAETGSLSGISLKVHSDDGESDDPQSQEERAQFSPNGTEVRSLDGTKDTESEDSEGLLVIDTSCVVVKMELIPSPKKEHVHYLGCTAEAQHSAPDIHSTASPESVNQVSTSDRNTENTLQIKGKPTANPHSDLTENRALNNESEISSPCLPTSSASETLEERALRILGIPLYDCVTEQQCEHAPPVLDLCPEEQDEEVESSPIALPDAVRQITERQNRTEAEQSQNHLEVGQNENAMCSKDSDDASDQVTNEDSADFAGCPEPQCNMPEQNDPGFQAEIPPETKTTGDNQVEPTGGGIKTEQSLEESQLAENDASSQHFSSPEDLANSPALSHSSLIPLVRKSESNTEKGLDSKVAALDTAENLAPHPETSSFVAPLEHLPSPPFPAPAESSRASTPLTDHSPSSPPHLISETLEATTVITLCTDSQDEPSQLVENEFNDALEDFANDMRAELMPEPQSGRDQPDDLATDDNIFQPQLKCVKVEDGDSEKQSHMTEEPIKTDIKSPAVLLEMTTHQDNVIDSQIPREEHCDKEEQEDACCVKESCVNEEQPQRDVDPAGLLEPKISPVNTTDCQAHAETEILQDTKPQTEPPGSDAEVSLPPLDELSHAKRPSAPCVSHKPNTEPAPLWEVDSVSPSVLHADTGDNTFPETVSPLDLVCNEEFLSCIPSDSASNLVISCTPLSAEGVQSVNLDLPHVDEPQYPMSLWDAVNRIRKHTAPDSDNEEEEVSELWDPESLGEDLGCPGVAEDRNSRKMVFDGAEQQEVLTEGGLEDREVGLIQQDARHEEPSGHAEEDTLSCSSTSSHSSGDTVIVAEEDEVQEAAHAAETGSDTETNQEFHKAEEERRCSCELKDENAGEADEEQQQNERDSNVFCVSEECTAEVENITAEITEVTETEQKETKEEILTPSGVAEVSEEVTG